MQYVDAAQEYDRGFGLLDAAECGAGAVAQIRSLLGEVAVDQHGEQSVGGRRGYAQALCRVGDSQRTLLLQELGEVQRVVDGLDCVRRLVPQLVLHNRKRYPVGQNYVKLRWRVQPRPA